MLAIIPPEVLSHIALHLCLQTDRPTPPISLLLTSKSINSTLSPNENPNLYARLFRIAFDVQAVERRFGYPHSSVQLTAELRKRVRTLYRLEGLLKKGDVKDVREEDLWVIYLMILENDGNNLAHLINENGFYLPKFLEVYQSQILLAQAIQPGYPDETVAKSLAMWIGWLLSGHGKPQIEPVDQRDERMFVMRPYVFASQKYSTYFGPWTAPDLPLNHHNILTGQAAIPEAHNPFIADLTPKSRMVTIEFYGKNLNICPPILSHAAILSFFSKTTRNPNNLNDGGPDLDMEVETNSDGENSSTASSDSMTNDHTMSITDSRLHDRDFQRLVTCYNPLSSVGMKPSVWRGSFNGCWEGNFSFFDFDAFREMLAGQSQALYTGPYGEQAQVWKLTETYVRRKRPVKRKSQDFGDEIMEETREDSEGESNVQPPKGLPLRGPSTNAGFPTDLPSSTSAGLGSASAEAVTLRETIRQQVEAIEGYEIVPPEELEEMLDDPYTDGESRAEEDGLEMLLTGTGHSAWGRFILKGRVRVWDGMASLVKEYAPDARGKWIYRGYVLSGGVFVGRWRDTFTPDAYVGYEGSFILNRRK